MGILKNKSSVGRGVMLGTYVDNKDAFFLALYCVANGITKTSVFKELISEKLKQLKLEKAAALVEGGAEETFSYYDFPPTHWRSIRTNNPPERINRELRRRTGVVGNFPDGQSALMLVCARLRYIAGHKWGTERYLNMRPLYQPAF